MKDSPQNEIQKTEKELYELVKKLEKLRRDNPPAEVKNYNFQTLEGETSLLELFGDKQVLFAIHNMGQGCRYCTLWADGFNAFLPHLESEFAVALLSKDSPELQRQFANSRGWRFRMASHGGGAYMNEQSVGEGNMPGMVCYVRKGDKIFRKNATPFGPGDQFCSLWDILSLAGRSEEDWTPQFRYWNPPGKLDDGGNNIK